MGLTTGFVLLILGVVLILVSLPRRNEDLRPFLRSSFAQALVPALCLGLIAFGIAFILTDL